MREEWKDRDRLQALMHLQSQKKKKSRLWGWKGVRLRSKGLSQINCCGFVVSHNAITTHAVHEFDQ